jgi:3-deoxy-D-manno-octulosonate 8-phosphate phosphatase (KDO 8-P phosphatase)
MPGASSIKVIVSDVDGVWTDGKIVYVGDQGEEIKEFNVRDGLAVKLAQRAGITVALVTSRSSRALERRANELRITELHQGAGNKLEEVQKLMRKLEVKFDEILYAGDDLPDLALMMTAGISAAPSDACAEVRNAAKWKLETRGGAGAFREIVERLLRERGEWDRIVQEFAIGKPEAQSI